MEGRHTRVLYVGGFGRSGSTLVGRVLGEAPDAVCVGETRYLCTRGIIENVQCGCGEPFRSCAFWSAVGEVGFGGWNRLDTARLLEVDALTDPLRRLPRHYLRRSRSEFSRAIEDYASWLRRLYEAISEVTGGKLIVETSKNPNFASLLTRMPGTDLRIVHLVRDSRAVAYSWTRAKRMPSPIGGEQFMPKFSPRRTAARWLLANLAFPAIAAGSCPYMRLRYDDFVGAPRDALERLEEFAETPLSLEPSALRGDCVKLGAHHIFSGNPMRASTGWLQIRNDDEWQLRMPKHQFAEVTGLTWALLRLYGYPAIPAARRASGARGAAVGGTCEPE